MFSRYASGLRTFFAAPVKHDQCLAAVQNQLRRRTETFLSILERGVFQNAGSPWLALLRHAQVEFSQVVRWVERSGVEGALDELYARGVYLTLDEFKAKKPILRDGLELRPKPHDFDNPLLTCHYESKTGGSRGNRTRLMIDLDLLAYEAAQTSLMLSQFGLIGRPI